MPHFAIERLELEQLQEAWPVVRMSGLHANLDWWLSDATQLMERGGGVLAVRAPDGSIHGIATFEPTGRPANRLAVEIFITFELSRGAPARRGLREGLDRVAAALDCTRIVWPNSVKIA